MKSSRDPVLLLMCLGALGVMALIVASYTEALTWSGQEIFTRIKIF